MDLSKFSGTVAALKVYEKSLRPVEAGLAVGEGMQAVVERLVDDRLGKVLDSKVSAAVAKLRVNK